MSFLATAVGASIGCSTTLGAGGIVTGTLVGPVATEACVGDVYLAVPSADCPFLTGCPGTDVYAVCQGTAYTACDCDVPPGLSPASSSSGGPDAGPDVATGPEGGPETSTGPDGSSGPETSTGPDGSSGAETSVGPDGSSGSEAGAPDGSSGAG